VPFLSFGITTVCGDRSSERNNSAECAFRLASFALFSGFILFFIGLLYIDPLTFNSGDLGAIS